MRFSVIQKIMLLFILILIALQFIPLDQSHPEGNGAKGFLQYHSSGPEAQMLQAACYDCHSNEVDYPWYASVAPVSWYLQNHINHGREKLNFSIWSTYSDSDREHLLEEMVEEIEENKMPLKSYRLLHGDARLSGGEKELLINWLVSLK